MSSETIMMAGQCRLRKWAAQIRDCQSLGFCIGKKNWVKPVPVDGQKPVRHRCPA